MTKGTGPPRGIPLQVGEYLQEARVLNENKNLKCSIELVQIVLCSSMFKYVQVCSRPPVAVIRYRGIIGLWWIAINAILHPSWFVLGVGPKSVRLGTKVLEIATWSVPCDACNAATMISSILGVSSGLGTRWNRLVLHCLSSPKTTQWRERKDGEAPPRPWFGRTRYPYPFLRRCRCCCCYQSSPFVERAPGPLLRGITWEKALFVLYWGFAILCVVILWARIRRRVFVRKNTKESLTICLVLCREKKRTWQQRWKIDGVRFVYPNFDSPVGQWDASFLESRTFSGEIGWERTRTNPNHHHIWLGSRPHINTTRFETRRGLSQTLLLVNLSNSTHTSYRHNPPLDDINVFVKSFTYEIVLPSSTH